MNDELTNKSALAPTDGTAPASAVGSSLVAGSAAKPVESGSISDASASKAAAAITAVSDPKSSAYKIGPQDVLDVSVFKVAELSKTIQVSDGGSINLPLLGEVPVAGSTARDVEQDLTKKLGAKYLQNPQVTVYIKEYNSQRVTVEGAVKKPGVFPIRGRSTLLQTLALAEGLEKISDQSVVILRQGESGKRLAARFDVAEIRSGTVEDPVIQSGDVVVAGTSAFKENLEILRNLMPVGSFLALL